MVVPSWLAEPASAKPYIGPVQAWSKTEADRRAMGSRKPGAGASHQTELTQSGGGPPPAGQLHGPFWPTTSKDTFVLPVRKCVPLATGIMPHWYPVPGM